MKFIRAKSISYSSNIIPYSYRKAIVIHFTGNVGDTAEGNCHYFSPYGGNQREAGAHIFVDQRGKVCKSIPLSRAAWSVGILFYRGNGAGAYWGALNNYNTISIEMCDCATKDPSKKMVKGLKKAIKYIRKHCPNATKLVRHYDICGKTCPGRMTGGPGTVGYERWRKLLRELGELDGKSSKPKKKKKKTISGNGNTSALCTVKVTATDGLNVRKGPSFDYQKVSELKYKERVKVYETRNNGWYRIGVGKWVNGYYTHKVTKDNSSPWHSKSHKSVEQLAYEVINGKWGNGDTRKKRLKAAGYDYNKVQQRVNQILG